MVARKTQSTTRTSKSNRSSKARRAHSTEVAAANAFLTQSAQALDEPLPLIPPNWLVAESDADERRERPRTQAVFGVRLYSGDGQDTYLEARLAAVDVSMSGIFLKSTFFLPVGHKVRVEFEVPETGRVLADGRVVRVQSNGDESGIGIRFERFEEGALESLIAVFIADQVERFVKGYSAERRAGGEFISPTALLHAILAWELYRSSAGPGSI